MGQAHVRYTAMKVRLQKNNPDLRILGFSFDSSDNMEQTLLENMGDLFDGLMQCHHNPQASHMLSNPHYKKKIIPDHLLPINDRHFGTTNRPLLPQIFFRGTMRHPHWARVLWLAAADRSGLPIQWEINQFLHTNEISLYDSSPNYQKWLMEDYATYMRKLTDATCCLSILMFGDMAHYLTGRSFEVLLSGALLIQEYSPLMHNHFIPGEHYLEFTTIAELSSITRFITENREEAEEVRRRGYAFARECYSDERIVSQIDQLLYPSGVDNIERDSTHVVVRKSNNASEMYPDKANHHTVQEMDNNMAAQPTTEQVIQQLRDFTVNKLREGVTPSQVELDLINYGLQVEVAKFMVDEELKKLARIPPQNRF